MAPVSAFISSLLTDCSGLTAGVRALDLHMSEESPLMLYTSLLGSLAPATVLLRSSRSFLVLTSGPVFSALRDLAPPSSLWNGRLCPLWASFWPLPFLPWILPAGDSKRGSFNVLQVLWRRSMRMATEDLHKAWHLSRGPWWLLYHHNVMIP